jgi:7tm Chemosensory receptor
MSHTTTEKKILWAFRFHLMLLNIYGLLIGNSKPTILRRTVSKVHLVIILMAILICFNKVRMWSVSDADIVIQYCQFIDRLCVFGGVICIYIDVLMFPKTCFKIFKHFANLDERLKRSMKIELNYKKLIFNSRLLLPSYFICIALCVRRMVKNKVNFELLFNESMYNLWYFIGVFYAMIVLQIYHRLHCINSSLKKSDSHDSEEVFSIFLEISQLIKSINDNFGVSMLIFIGGQFSSFFFFS